MFKTLKQFFDFCNQEDRNKLYLAIALGVIKAIFAAAVSVIVFFLTEDLTKLMAFTDRWTILMVLILLAEVVFHVLARREKTRREENEETETA